MMPAERADALGYLDELREALQSPYMQLLFSPGFESDESIQKAIAARFGNRPPLQNVGEETPFVENATESRWEMIARIAEQAEDVRANAIAVISALGFCRLYGISLPSDIKTKLSSPLPAELLVPAVVDALRMLEIATDDARALPIRFDSSEPLEDRSHCTSLLHLIMELWAIFNVVDDEYQRDISERQKLDSPFGVWMHRLLNAFAALDDELQRDEQIRLLSVAAELPLLANWRKMLVVPYSDPLPWWLDGTLEAIAAQTAREIIELPPLGQKTSGFGVGAADDLVSNDFERYIRIAVGSPHDQLSSETPFVLAAQSGDASSKAELNLPLKSGGVLRLFANPQQIDWITIHVEGLDGPVAIGLEINGATIELIEPFNEDNYAVAMAHTLGPAMRGEAELTLLCQAKSTKE